LANMAKKVPRDKTSSSGQGPRLARASLAASSSFCSAAAEASPLPVPLVSCCWCLRSRLLLLRRRLLDLPPSALAAVDMRLLSSCHSLLNCNLLRTAAGSIPYFVAVPDGRMRSILSSRMPPDRRSAARSKMALRRFSLPENEVKRRTMNESKREMSW